MDPIKLLEEMKNYNYNQPIPNDQKRLFEVKKYLVDGFK
jgi:hypothetical protein